MYLVSLSSIGSPAVNIQRLPYIQMAVVMARAMKVRRGTRTRRGMACTAWPASWNRWITKLILLRRMKRMRRTST